MSELKFAGLGDHAVREATGRGWEEWFQQLDSAGAKEMEHAAIALHLSKSQRVPDWWCQMLTVGYEQARGLRQKHQRPDGFSVSASRTLAVPVHQVYEAFADATARERWLPDPGFTVHKATPARSMRLAWIDGASSVEVNFYEKGAAKSQVTVQHSKLPDAESAVRMKAYWGTALDTLRAVLMG
ncbi:MAG: hypothetical protein EXR95_05790 [Gemmatimonadetes bacterium]|nr:hypothetical protein [Gemmatimonadota bacterium]